MTKRTKNKLIGVLMILPALALVLTLLILGLGLKVAMIGIAIFITGSSVLILMAHGFIKLFSAE
jgi:hypothetical protein